VYIIDEVHMLTKEAFNALLKTLEEPPEHVVFILATTELAKVPETIISRAQVYRFERPTLEVLASALVDAAKAEGSALEKDAALLLARLADGAFRDAYGLLQQILAGVSHTPITRADIEKIVGASPRVLAYTFARSLCEKKFAEALKTAQSLSVHNSHAKNFGEDVLDYVRAVLLVRFSALSDEQVIEQFGKDVASEIRLLAKSATHINSLTLIHLIDAMTLLRTSTSQVLPFEICVLKIAEASK
jgi:DNA polymerase-3 subunit gamma/tau